VLLLNLKFEVTVEYKREATNEGGNSQTFQYKDQQNHISFITSMIVVVFQSFNKMKLAFCPMFEIQIKDGKSSKRRKMSETK
jgi:hypothetical protein